MSDELLEVSEQEPTKKVFAKRTPTPKPEKVGLYFTQTKKENLEMFSSGCHLLDCVLGGGWPLGRMSNIVGDFSTGKTLLAIESCANFHHQYPKGKMIYLEAEAAFDESYAEALGMPINSIEFIGESFQDFTIEAWFDHLDNLIKEFYKHKHPCLYIVDSLDALSDRAEKSREFGKGSYGGEKPKMIGQLFRRSAKDIERTKIHLQIISQIRDNIGVSFGAKHTRTGGKAMDFYASQVLWLSQLKKLKRTIRKQERVYGIQIKAQCKKNKIGLPFREAEFPVIFGYGIDDVEASLAWLESIDFDVDQWNEYKEGKKSLADSIKQIPMEERKDLLKQIKNAVTINWEEIENRFMPTERKY